MERGGARGVSYRSLVGYLLSTAKLDVLAFLHEHLSGPLEDLLALECNHDGFALLWLHLRDNIDEFIEVFSHLRVFAFRGDDGEGKEQNARQEKDARRAWEKRETAGHGHRGVAEQKRTRVEDPLHHQSSLRITKTPFSVISVWGTTFRLKLLLFAEKSLRHATPKCFLSGVAKRFF